MSFVVNHAWAIASILVVLAGASLWFFARGGGTKPLIAGVAFAVSAFGLVVMDQFIETPTEAVRKRLLEIVSSASAGDSEAIIASISENYDDGIRDKAALANLVRRHFSSARELRVTLAGLQLTEEADGRVATKFVAHIRGEYQGQSSGTDSYPVRLSIDFVREGDVWQMSRVRRFDTIQSAREVPLDRVP